MCDEIKRADDDTDALAQEGTVEVLENENCDSEPNVTDSTDEGKKEVEELQTRIQRLQADFENFRRRSRSETAQISSFVSAQSAAKFLPVADSLERALVSTAQDAESLRKGLDLIYRQMEKALQDVGLEKIVALGEQFSPELHEALMNTQNPELPDGQIAMVFEDGYKMQDKVIRHSKVRVVNNS
jgi:molecular chaperone GrpE